MSHLGRPPKKCPFEGATRKPASLYVVEFDDGTIKVGQSNNPQSRMKSLEYQARKMYAIAIVRWHVFAGAGVVTGAGDTDRCRFHARRLARRMETLCLAQLARIATTRGPGREFFTGLKFEAAVAHVASVIEQVSESTKGGDVGVLHQPNVVFFASAQNPNHP